MRPASSASSCCAVSHDGWGEESKRGVAPRYSVTGNRTFDDKNQIVLCDCFSSGIGQNHYVGMKTLARSARAFLSCIVIFMPIRALTKKIIYIKYLNFRANCSLTGDRGRKPVFFHNVGSFRYKEECKEKEERCNGFEASQHATQINSVRCVCSFFCFPKRRNTAATPVTACRRDTTME